MSYQDLVIIIADILKKFDEEKPVHKKFQPGIGPFGEPQIVKIISNRLIEQGIRAKTKRNPDMDIQGKFGIEFKIVRPFGDNGKEAENWTVNLLHPYPGNTSLIGDAIKLLSDLPTYDHKCLFVIGYEHDPPKISLDPIIDSFELITQKVMRLNLGERIEERRNGLIHPEHRVVRCFGWEIF